jgi:histidine triad (HIT) family protein
MDCIFCKIVNNEIPSYTIYEDDIVKVFLDINPSSDGHMLVIPKKHFENILDIDLDTLSHINSIEKKMYMLLKEKLNVDGVTICQNNEYGQDVKHFHVHLTPRYKNDGVKINYPKEKRDLKVIFEILKGE